MAATLDGTRQEIVGLASRVLGAAGGDEDHAWRALADAGLLAIGLPERWGGDGLRVADAALVLAEVGRQALPVPVLETLALGALPLARHGTEEQQAGILPGVATGAIVLTAALHEPSTPLPTSPRTITRRDGDGVLVSGTKVGVRHADRAHRVLVPVTHHDAGPGVALVDPTSAGVRLSPSPSAAGIPVHGMQLDDVRVPAGDLLGPAALSDLYRLGLAGAAATADGLLSAALALTAAHVGSRRQFGRPLASFQAVAQQVADVYVVARAVHLAARSACERLSDGRSHADADPEIAALWVAEEVPAAIGTCHHLHGGVGLDRTYPLHRYSAAATDLARLVGGVDRGVDRLADRLFGVAGDTAGGAP
jgi:alkylation response protein AidB-like acyl-CoA dehydrogenase